LSDSNYKAFFKKNLSSTVHAQTAFWSPGIFFFFFFFFFLGVLLLQNGQACRIGPRPPLQDESVEEAPDESPSCRPRSPDDGDELTATPMLTLMKADPYYPHSYPIQASYKTPILLITFYDY
jgi:hypothetical protein